MATSRAVSGQDSIGLPALDRASTGARSNETAAASIAEQKGMLPKTQQDKSGHCGASGYTGFMLKVKGKFEDGFGWLGLQTSRRPWLTMLISVVLCALCSLGFTNFYTESRPEELWISKDTDAFRDNNYVESTWTENPRFNVFYAKADGGGNLLTPSRVQKLYAIHREILSVNVTAISDSDKYPGKWDYARACFREGGFCVTLSPLDLFEYNATLIGSLTQDEIDRRVNESSYYVTPYGRKFTKKDLFGYPDLDTSKDPVALRGTYVLQQHEVEKDGSRKDVVGIPWEREGIKKLRGDNSPLDTVPLFQVGWSDEFSEAIQADGISLVIAYLLITVYLIVTLGRRDPVDCMVGVSMCAVLGVGMAICASWGLAAGFGIMFTPLHLNIPFLLLGLGVDDAFILVSEFQRALRKGMDDETAMVQALKVGGMSIFITSLTDFLAFVIGSTTVLPALSSFCIYAGLGVLFDFFFQITFFMACVSLNAKRSRKRRRDFICCFKDADESFEPFKSEARGCCCCVCEPCKSDIIEPTCIQFSKLVVQIPFRVFIFVIFFVFLGLSANGIHRMETNFQLSWFLPDGSYLLEAIRWEKDYFESSTPFGIYLKDIDYFNRQDGLNRIDSFLQTSNYVIEQSSSFWFRGFISWAAVTLPYSSYFKNVSGVVSLTNQSLFYNGIDEYIKSDGSRYQREILWYNSSNPSEGIQASRGGGQINVNEYTDTSKERYEAMDNLRKECDKAMEYSDARVFSRRFLFWEEYAIILEELVRNICIAVAVMFLIVFLMIVQWQVVIAVAIAIGATIINTLGMAYYWGVQLNSVVTIFILISIGLSVDYSAHIGHTFVETSGTAHERTVAALTKTGPPVFNAIFSTFIAILVLVGARTYIYEVFFQIFLLTTLFGGFNGLVLLPVILATFGGDKKDHISNRTKVKPIEVELKQKA